MINPHQLLVPKQRERPGRNRNTRQRRAHARTLGIADAIDVIDSHASFLHRFRHQSNHMGAVMLGGVLGEKTLARRRMECVAQVAQYLYAFWSGAQRVFVCVADYADAELVGGAFEAD